MAKKSTLIKVLSIDGGGIRGIIPGQIMVEIEKEFKIIPADYFDIISGTSTGGILACAYLCPDKSGKNPRYNCEQVVNLYFEYGDDIFDIPFFHKIVSAGGLIDEKYPEDGIEDVLEDHFGELWLKDLLKPCLITSYDIKSRKGHFFYQHKAKNDKTYNFKVKDVARATAAAPTYFEAALISSQDGTKYPLIDGGVFVNNPSICAYSEVRKMSKFKRANKEEATAKDMKILSLGTGTARQKYRYSKAKNWGMAEWIKPLIDIMMSGSSDVNHFHLNKIYSTINSDQYLRINGPLPKGADAMDNVDPGNLKVLKTFAQELFEKSRDKIEKYLAL